MSTARVELPNSELSDFLDNYLSNPAHSEQQVADRFKVSLQTVQRWHAGEFWENPYLMKVIIRLLQEG